jgi:PAS domain S-box-containing protein
MDADERNEPATTRTGPPELSLPDSAVAAILDAIPDVIGVQDRDHHILFYNRTGYELLQLPRFQVLGRRCFELIGRSGPCGDCPVAEAIATGQRRRSRRYEPSLEAWIDVRAYPLFDARGEVTHVIEHLRNITKEHRNEEALRAGEERYRLLTENQRDIVVACDTSGAITYCSPAVREFGGYDPEAVLGTAIADYFAEPEDRTLAAERMARMFEDRVPAVFELTYKPRTGEPFPVEISAKPVIEDGEVVGFHGIARDIRERVRAEQERAALEERLMQAEKMEAIGRLAGGVAHDFNNLLTAISGCAELALRRPDDRGAVRPDLERILACSRRAAELTGQLLAFSRRQTAAPRVVDLNAAVDDVLGLLARILRENIELRVDAGAGLWPVLIDPAQLERVLVNLATNAEDSIEGPGRIEIVTGNLPGSAGTGEPERVRLVFRDDGAGMEPAVASRIFEPFFTTKAAGRGTGLGLATVLGIVEQNRGTIRVETAPGKGTSFEILLPRAAGEATKTAPPPAPRRTAPGGGTAVLVAEDEPTVRSLICRILAHAGYEPIPAADGAEALRLARAASVPLRALVTDVVMPGMDGLELARHLADEIPGLVVLFVSGYAEDVLAREGLIAGHIPLLQKPFTADALLDALGAALAGAGKAADR